MKPAQNAQRQLQATKLLVISGHRVQHTAMAELPDYLRPGDLLVVNRSGTLPASLRGHVQRTGAALEIRLAAFQGPDSHSLDHWLAVTFGAGDWRVPTEARGAPPEVCIGDKIVFGERLHATVLQVQSSRLLKIRLASPNLVRDLYKHGRPIQYSYMTSALEVWDQQTLFSGPPISVEPPSAAFPFTWDLIFRLQLAGVQIVPLLHGAGLSSTGSRDLDHLLPLSEWYAMPSATASAVNLARYQGRRVVALGTSALRAMESSIQHGELRASSGLTSLRISPDYKIKSATGLLTGMHEAGTSHMEILRAFCGEPQITAGYVEAEHNGYRGHEYGDVALLDGVAVSTARS